MGDKLWGKMVVRYLPSEPCPRCATPPPSCSGSTPEAASKSGPAENKKPPVSKRLFGFRHRGGTTAWKIKELRSDLKRSVETVCV